MASSSTGRTRFLLQPNVFFPITECFYSYKAAQPRWPSSAGQYRPGRPAAPPPLADAGACVGTAARAARKAENAPPPRLPACPGRRKAASKSGSKAQKRRHVRIFVYLCNVFPCPRHPAKALRDSHSARIIFIHKYILT